jgi:MtN3 and saliva related transmembrane protein
MTEVIGWASSLILLATILNQVYKQWSEGTSEGVSVWLFIGQIAASCGFVVYSFLVGNTVFIFTNSLLAISAVLGLVICLRQKKDEH